jgi:asparagine synthase (glutamine-hydrolysing)
VLAFSSEIQPLLELPWVDRSPDEVRVADFLIAARSDDGRRTFHRGVRQVPAASWVEAPLDLAEAPRTTRYWVPRVEPHDMSLPEATARIRDTFIDAMELHLRSDVPVGSCLSGGIDSSAIVCAMREIGGRSLDLHTFSYVSSDPATSEERWISIVNQRVGATAHLVRPDDDDLGSDLAQLNRTQHEPFGSTSVYAQHRVFAAAAGAGVKVVLDGQGADELLAGYPAFRVAMLRHAVRTGAARSTITLALGLARTTTSGRNDLARLLGSKTGALLRRRQSRPRVPWYPHLLRPSELLGAGRGDDLHSLLIESIETSSLPGLLRFEDRNSMAHSVESRVPFLTTALADLALGLPSSYLISSAGETKHVFRQAMRGLVPDEILDRRDKIGFVPTESRWLAHAPLLPLPSAPASIRRLFVPDLAERLAQRPMSGEDTWGAEESALFRSWAVLEWAERSRLEGSSGSDAANVGSLGDHG